MMAITYLFQQEDVPIKPYCMNLDRTCKQKDCIAWYSLGNGWGRCLFVPGIEREKSGD